MQIYIDDGTGEEMPVSCLHPLTPHTPTPTPSHPHMCTPSQVWFPPTPPSDDDVYFDLVLGMSYETDATMSTASLTAMASYRLIDICSDEGVNLTMC